MPRPIVLAVVLALVVPAPLVARGQSQSSDDPPVSLERIKRALQQAPHHPATLDDVRLAYYVSVTASQPPIDIFKDFDWKHGPVPGAPPTHREMIEHVTPLEYSAPVADLTAVGAWLASKIAHRK